MKEYEKKVMQHYTEVAKEEVDSPLSTMKSEYIRKKETDAIICAINKYKEKNKKKLTIVDIGCGNGYTIFTLSNLFPNEKYVGIEKNDDLRDIAKNREYSADVNILQGDVRFIDESLLGTADIVISQRMIINLLDEADQISALENIGKIVKKAGMIILIECMQEALNTLNNARKEFDLQEIKPSFHNLYLRECMLNKLGSDIYRIDDGVPASNFLSTHYYVSRVLHDVALNGKPFTRNSNFVAFFDELLGERNIGDYSPIKFYAFEKKGE